MTQDRVAPTDSRSQAALAVMAALLLYITLPPRLIIGPVWFAPLLVLLLLIPLLIVAPRRDWSRRTRVLGILLIALVNFFNLVSVLLLIVAFFHPELARIHQPAQLLLTGAQIWFTNIIVFGLWYWELDANGPDARARAKSATHFRNADFLFPQMQVAMMSEGASCVDLDWKPEFLDYLYLAFTDATAFSPADVMPLSRWAKALMGAEALVSLITIVIVFSRAISLIS